MTLSLSAEHVRTKAALAAARLSAQTLLLTYNIETLSRRHLEALTQALDHLLIGKKQLEIYPAGELLAEDYVKRSKLWEESLENFTQKIYSEKFLG